MVSIPNEQSVNLEELRATLTRQIAWFVVIAAAFTLWINLPQRVYPFDVALLAALMLSLGWVIARNYYRSPLLMRWLLILGMNAGLLSAMVAFEYEWLPLAALLVIFTATALNSLGGLLTAILAAGLTIWLDQQNVRHYDLMPFLGALTAGVVIAWLTVNKLLTALEWTKTTHSQVLDLLDETRTRRAELVHTVKLLEQTNAALQRAQGDLVFAQHEAEKAKLLKQQFVANISHELRAPLNLILGFSEVMYQSPNVYGEMVWPPRLRQDVSKIYRSSRHLLGMIDDILDLAYFESVGYLLNLEHTPMTPFLIEAADIASDLFHGKDVALLTEIAPSLPVVDIDRTRIRQVVLNLLNNAHRYTDHGSVTMTASLQPNGKLRISISDTGRGIPADSLASIFDEFHQVDPSFRRENGGAGLGLTISKKFIEAHGGYIEVDSVLGEGSTFTFSLPVSNTRAVSAISGPVDPQITSMQPCALLLSPNHSTVGMLERHITDFEFIPIEDSDALPSAVRDHHPRAVLCEADEEIALPELPIPVISFSLPRQTWATHAHAGVGYMSKPITTFRLLEAIERVGTVRRILIVDDDVNFIHLVERIVQTTGRSIEMRRALSGEEALAQMQASHPDLVLLDLSMPEMDGYQVLEAIQALPAPLNGIPIIFISSYSAIESMAEYGGAPITISRTGGLYLAESIRYLRAVLGELEAYVEEPARP